MQRDRRRAAHDRRRHRMADGAGQRRRVTDPWSEECGAVVAFHPSFCPPFVAETRRHQPINGRMRKASADAPGAVLDYLLANAADGEGGPPRRSDESIAARSASRERLGG
jgi:hypothetical protein